MRESPSPPSSARRDFLIAAATGAAASVALPTLAEAQTGDSGAIGQFVTPQAFGALGDGRTDDGPALQRAVDSALATGRPVFVPAGTYRVGRPIMIRPSRYFPYADAFAAGPHIFGAGSGLTVFETSAAGALFDVDSNADHQREFRVALGVVFEGLTIRAGAAARGAVGIRLRSAFNARIQDVHIVGLGSHGVEIVCLDGDRDGSNMVSLEQVRIDDCGGWGISAKAAPGRNEISFLKLQHVLVQRCGTASTAALPQSGGMTWKGQICSMEQCGFALNANCGLFIPGEAGLGQSIDIRNTAFENNRGRHLLCTGITGFKGRNLQFYSNDEFAVNVACEFDASRFTVRVVDIDGVAVRATAGNDPCLGFRIGGPHAELDQCRVRNVAWENFDYPGQSRFAGWQFDHVEQCCTLQRSSASEVRLAPMGRGNKMPLRLRTGTGGTPSRTGEWIAAAIPGLGLSSNGLRPDRSYHVYLFDDRGVKRLEAAEEGPVLDPASGYLVAAGDPAKLHVGEVHTDNAGNFRTPA